MFRYLGWDGMRPQCCSFGIWGMGGTACTHHTTFGKREVEVHSIVGGSFGEGLEGWNILLLMYDVQGSHHDIFVWRWRACMGEGMSMHDSFGLGKGRVGPLWAGRYGGRVMGACHTSEECARSHNRTLYIEPMKRVAKAHNRKSIMHRVQRWQIQKHKNGIKLEKRVSRRHNWERLPDNRQSLIALEDKREITKAKGLKEHRGGYDMKTTSGMGHKRVHSMAMQWGFPQVKEVQCNNVVEEGTNDGSGNHGGEMGEDIQTTNYGDTMPTGAFSTEGMNVVSPCMQNKGTALPFNHDSFISEDQETGGNTWEKFNRIPVPIKWPEEWGQEDSVNSMHLDWEDIMKVVRNSWTVNLGTDQMDKDLILFYMGIDHSKENDAKFFKEYDTVVEYLAKWKDCHKLNDHEAWRKIPVTNSQNSRWLDVEREACHLEEAKQRKKKKKRKLKGENPFNVCTQDKTQYTETGPDYRNGKEYRRKIKVWSSKNHNPSKNFFTQKVNFMQNFVPSKPTITHLGFSAFKVGHDKNKEHQNRLAPKENIVSRMHSLYAELVAKETKLKEIVININKTDKNTALLNSILGMKSCKLRKFSAKVNEQGVVIIDENMVQPADTTEENNPAQNEIPNTSYATILSGKNNPLREEKIQFYPPMDDEGFTVVKRRKNNNRQTGLGSENNQRNNNAQRWRRRNNDEHHVVSNRKTGTPGLVNLHERNIVINQNREELPESLGAGRGEEVVGTNSGNKPDSPSPRLHDQNKMVSRESITGKGTNATTPNYRVVEMTNRFSLLDTEGNEVENVIEGMENTTTQVNKPSRSNEGWIKKQERILNTEYSEEINQEQRFEVKRYVIDQLIPLESVLSGWSNPQLQYFRQLCSIHNFGLGYLAANREGGDDMSDVDMGMDAENTEEVETETEGAAVMMKDDGPIATNIVNQNSNETNPCSPNQRDVDMLQAGNKSVNC
ncbi:hypothetical protein L1987_84580 [Smallanthus sonchifolius]|uniref:Uncharacterized protein n=1 Tax=Smallanthus sonchifolius TaxID=185202 RepID=A0ACB8XU63_9ASTR|nr:hypothetical protein L1987_84580 [Smallanthus sonchifolius]